MTTSPRPPQAAARTVGRDDRGERMVTWLIRGLWALLPLTAGPVLAEALHGASTPVRTVASIGLWTGWAVGAGAAFVRSPVTLTALRVLAPAAVVAAAAAAAGGHTSALALGWTAVVAAWAFSPSVGSAWVNGPAYPNERRYLLRAPLPLLVGGLPLAWCVAVVGVAAGPLLVAAEQWVAGGAALAVGWPLAWVFGRGMHNLSRRWAVFVPAGMVLHDPVSLLDPYLFQRRHVRRLGPALAARPAATVDLTQRAPGLAMELVVNEPADLTLMRPGRREGERRQVERLLFTPTRPGALLDEARRRRLPT